jgi:hypothetical protein
MKGRRSFSVNEIHVIERTLDELQRCDPPRRRALHGKLRRQYRFYVSDFAPRRCPVSSEEVERLISQGVIRVR